MGTSLELEGDVVLERADGDDGWIIMINHPGGARTQTDLAELMYECFVHDMTPGKQKSIGMMRIVMDTDTTGFIPVKQQSDGVGWAELIILIVAISSLYLGYYTLGAMSSIVLLTMQLQAIRSSIRRNNE